MKFKNSFVFLNCTYAWSHGVFACLPEVHTLSDDEKDGDSDARREVQVQQRKPETIDYWRQSGGKTLRTSSKVPILASNGPRKVIGQN